MPSRAFFLLREAEEESDNVPRERGPADSRLDPRRYRRVPGKYRVDPKEFAKHIRDKDARSLADPEPRAFSDILASSLAKADAKQWTYDNLPQFYSGLPRKLATYLRFHFSTIEATLMKMAYHSDSVRREEFVMYGLQEIAKNFKFMGTFESLLAAVKRDYPHLREASFSDKGYNSALSEYFRVIYGHGERERFIGRLQGLWSRDVLREENRQKREQRGNTSQEK